MDKLNTHGRKIQLNSLLLEDNIRMDLREIVWEGVD
jgi:hypothetical protein